MIYLLSTKVSWSFELPTAHFVIYVRYIHYRVEAVIEVVSQYAPDDIGCDIVSGVS